MTTSGVMMLSYGLGNCVFGLYISKRTHDIGFYMWGNVPSAHNNTYSHTDKF